MSKAKSPANTIKRATKIAAAMEPGVSKLDTIVALLRTPSGASIEELAAATAWQPHSVRGALAGALKKKGHSTSSEKVDGMRRYRVVETQA
jgi:hypothetical protein